MIENKRCNRSHFNINGTIKRGFISENESVIYCYKYNSNIFHIHKMVHYKCATCGKWHVGHTKTELTPEIRNDYKKRLKNFYLYI